MRLCTFTTRWRCRTPCEEARFTLSTRTYPTPRAILMRCQGTAFTMTRGPALAVRGPDQLLILLQIEGWCDTDCGGRRGRIEAGDVAIFDYARPFRRVVTDYGNLMAIVARASVPAALLALEPHGLIFPRESGAARLRGLASGLADGVPRVVHRLVLVTGVQLFAGRGDLAALHVRETERDAKTVIGCKRENAGMPIGAKFDLELRQFENESHTRIMAPTLFGVCYKLRQCDEQAAQTGRQEIQVHDFAARILSDQRDKISIVAAFKAGERVNFDVAMHDVARCTHIGT